MHSENITIHRWLVLLPHRDSLQRMYKLQHQLWQSGLLGARLLPPLCFLASVEKAASAEQRSRLARLIREKSQKYGEGGYIDGRGLGLFKLPGNFQVLGLSLSLDLAEARLSSPVLIIALQADKKALDLAHSLYTENEPFRFRQGAVANLAFTLHEDTNSSISLRWELGKPSWMAHHG